MFIDNILNTLLRPFREIYSQWMRVRGIKGGIQGDIRRVQMLGNQAQNYGRAALDAPGQLGQAAGFGGQQQQPPRAPAAPAMPAGKQKMSWFPWGKKTCPSCGRKLRKSWDRCPFCGQAQGPGAPPGGPGMQPGMPPGPGQGMPPGMQPPPGYPPQPGQGMPPGYPQQGMPPGYPQPGQSGGMPGMNMPVMGMGGMNPAKTIAMSADQINAPMLHAGQDGENVAWLVPLEGPQTGELLQLKGKATIGSGPAATFKVLDAAISSNHAEITVDGQNRFRITDLGSTNGTYVNDKRVASTDLVDGDNIRLGRTTFRFKTKH
jgi:hypothetical protein